MKNSLKLGFLLMLLSCFTTKLAAQTPKDTTRNENIILDSIFIKEIEFVPGEKPKILHAEPLYIDLIRDLGARKGENEWNFGFGMKADQNYDEYEALNGYLIFADS